MTGPSATPPDGALVGAGDMAAQAERAWEHIEASLAANGAGMGNVVSASRSGASRARRGTVQHRAPPDHPDGWRLAGLTTPRAGR